MTSGPLLQVVRSNCSFLRKLTVSEVVKTENSVFGCTVMVQCLCRLFEAPRETHLTSPPCPVHRRLPHRIVSLLLARHGLSLSDSPESAQPTPAANTHNVSHVILAGLESALANCIPETIGCSMVATSAHPALSLACFVEHQMPHVVSKLTKLNCETKWLLSVADRVCQREWKG
jgi:hypothetical protein